MVGIALFSLAVLAGYANWLASNTMLPTAARNLEGAAVSRVARLVNIENTWRQQIEEIANGRQLVDTLNLFTRTSYTRCKKSLSRIMARSINTSSGEFERSSRRVRSPR